MDIIGKIINNFVGSDSDSDSDSGSDCNTNNNIRKHKKSSRTQDSTYASNNSSKVKNHMTNLARKKYRASNHVSGSESGSGSDSEYSDDDMQSIHTLETMNGGQSIDFSDPTSFIDKQSDIVDNRKYERHTVAKVKDKNNFLSQFDSLKFDNPGGPASFNAVQDAEGSNSATKRMETERGLALDGGYSHFNKDNDGTYGVVPRDQFKVNAVPFHRGRGGMGTDMVDIKNRATQHQRKMELMTGSARNPMYRKKKEVGQFFSPIVNATNIYGNQIRIDEMIGRYIPSKYKRNQKPFEPIKQAPGIGLGYNEAPKHGFHEPYRVKLRTTDEIRGPKGPKVSYDGVVLPGKKGDKGPVMGKMVQRKPDRFKEWGTERLVNGFGYIRAPTLHGVYSADNMATKNRGVNDQQRYGVPGRDDQPLPEELKGKHNVPFRQNFRQAGPRNVHLVEGLGARPPSDTPFIPNTTLRDIHKVKNYVGVIRGGDAGGHKVFNPNDVPDPTLRNIHDNTGRQGVAIGGVAHEGHKVFNPNDVPDPTLRNIHNKTGRQGVAVDGVTREGHKIFNPNDVPDPTLRDIYNRTGRQGVAINGVIREGHKIFNPNDVPDPTLRDIHNKTGRQGVAINGVIREGHKIFNPNDVPGMTLRDIHNKTGRQGVAINGVIREGHKVFNPNDVPGMTLRDIHNKTGRQGVAINGVMREGHKVFNPNDVPGMTLRDIHNKTGRQGVGINGVAREGHRVFNPNDVPDMTLRDIHNKTGRQGVAVDGVTNEGHRVFNPNDVPNLTNRDMYKSKRSAGGAGHNVDGPVVFDYTNAIPAHTNRDMYKSSRAAGGAGHNIDGPVVFNYTEAIPAPTNRDMHKSSRAAGGAGHHVDAPLVFDYTGAIPNMTFREIHGKTKYFNHGKGHNGERSRSEVTNMNQNVTKEIIAKGRAPTTSNYSKGPSLGFTRTELKEPLQFTRMGNSRPVETHSRHLPTVVNNRNPRFYYDNRQNYTKDTLDGNPYINNMTHKAVPNSHPKPRLY